MDHRGADQRSRGHQHVAAAAQHARQRIRQPDGQRPAEEDVGVGERVGERFAFAAEEPVKRRAEGEDEDRECDRHAERDEERVYYEASCARRIARAEGARDSGGHAAAHGAGGAHLQEHDEREHEREAGERRRAEAPDEIGVAHRHQGLERD